MMFRFQEQALKADFTRRMFLRRAPDERRERRERRRGRRGPFARAATLCQLAESTSLLLPSLAQQNFIEVTQPTCPNRPSFDTTGPSPKYWQSIISLFLS